MKTLTKYSLFIIFFLMPVMLSAQSNFQIDDYIQFLQNNQNMETEALQALYQPANPYYKNDQANFVINDFSYLDSIIQKYNLTDDELQLLSEHHFVVTERLSFNSFAEALHNIYVKDLPVFISTDALLHAVHASYNRILMDLEINILEPQLIQFLENLYSTYPQLMSRYQTYTELIKPLEDVDLYVTIAYSLVTNQKRIPHFTSQQHVDQIWEMIMSERPALVSLFSDRLRLIDFSQFIPRGHYNQLFWDYNQNIERTLEDYFKAMMWLGRIDFLLTSPPANPAEEPWTEAELKRMNLGAVLLNELIAIAEAKSLLESNDQILTFLVGESDNLTPKELNTVLDTLGISSTEALLNDSTYANFQSAVTVSMNSEQKILSNLFLMDPFSTEPGILPISFKLLGQRFIIDSYIFSNVVYDRIVYQNEKIIRLMPDPLDITFVLGNNDALFLLKDELNFYKYSSQMAALRYLVDSFDENFWESSFYNLWLNTIRTLNPPADRTGFPFFMKTAAWHQQKLNSQLASWSQLRHDNLLYGKQSYSGMYICSFPQSFVEPNLSFFRQMINLAEKGSLLFSEIMPDNLTLNSIQHYFAELSNTMNKLSTIAAKELNYQPLDENEIHFLRQMLFESENCGAPVFNGWYVQLYYNSDDAIVKDFIVADVHTQPTDSAGNLVGKLLHVGVGKINLGVFLADSPVNNFQPTCFVGPLMSYYEKITGNFQRLTDEEWSSLLQSDDLPPRPDWVNIYLADKSGKRLPQGREIPYAVFTSENKTDCHSLKNYLILQNYPNPFNPVTTIRYFVEKPAHITITIHDLIGREIDRLIDRQKKPGQYSIQWQAGNLPSGIYLCQIKIGKTVKQTIKMTLIR